MNLINWAMKWGVSPAAVRDLSTQMGVAAMPRPVAPVEGASESAVSVRARLAASQRGEILLRNNVGVLKDLNGRPVRFGLANDSKAMNQSMKSGDLIGITPVHITAEHVGHTIGQFTSVECKHAGWVFSGTERETAQKRWAEFVISMGGSASFVSS